MGPTLPLQSLATGLIFILKIFTYSTLKNLFSIIFKEKLLLVLRSFLLKSVIAHRAKQHSWKYKAGLIGLLHLLLLCLNKYELG